MKTKCMFTLLLSLVLSTALVGAQPSRRPPTAEDLFAIKDVSDARVSPDGNSIVYTVTSIDRANNRYLSNLWLVPAKGGQSVQLTTGNGDSSPRWSPDGKKIAFSTTRDGKPSLAVVDVGTKETRVLAPWERSNFFLSKAGEMLSWSPDGKQIAFVAAEPPKQQPSTDPRVITRIRYKSRTSFSDDSHSHIFLVSVDDAKVRQLSRGKYDEHSISWSPRGDEIMFLSARGEDRDATFNYDIFTIEPTRGIERRITDTFGVELSPVWSPDAEFVAYAATKRKTTTIDSIAEDTHVWIINRNGEEPKEIGAALDRRAATPQWSADGTTLYFLAGDHGKSLIYRVPKEGGPIASLFDQPCTISSLSLSGGVIAFIRGDETTPGEVWSSGIDGTNPRPLTSVNKSAIAEMALVKPENIRFKSFDGEDIEGWLMKPPDLQPGKKCPMILSIHGGPHGMFGYGFNLAHQVYAARGYAVLYVNPRGSSGYGQKFSDGCLNSWGGGDYQDLMKGVDFALSKYNWLDENRLGVTGGSYGGFMTNWVISQTDRFKVAVAVASLSNLISFYGTSMYQDLIHVEFNGVPWENYDLLWKYSPLKYVKNVSTPTLFIHGEQDNDVHITQAEEMYMALKRRGIDTVFVRYPGEGHGFREPAHRLDQITRTVGWFDRYIKPNVE
jgi:dipeptidyl aminopeptidase/acylaminoacyl peptidase